jgi:hypothetical protein
MLLTEKNVISDLNSLNSTAVTLPANGERWESHAVLDKENATESQDVTPSTTAVPDFPREPLLVAPSKEPELKATAALENVFLSDPNFKLSFHFAHHILTSPICANKSPQSKNYLFTYP